MAGRDAARKQRHFPFPFIGARHPGMTLNIRQQSISRHWPLLAQFLRFGTVGGLGFIVDNAVVYGLRGSVGLNWAGALAFPAAATVTWAVNRIWTFRGQGSGSAGAQWLRFLAVNSVGFVLNRGTFFILVATSTLCVDYPVLATGAGTAAGMFVNFGLSRKIVFK